MMDGFALGAFGFLCAAGGAALGATIMGGLASHKFEQAQEARERSRETWLGIVARLRKTHDWETAELRAELKRTRLQRGAYLQRVTALEYECAQLRASQKETIRVLEGATAEVVTEASMEVELKKIGVAS